MIRQIARLLLPQPVRRQCGRARDRLREQWTRLKIWPRVGFVRFGDLRRIEPLQRAAAQGELTGVEQYYLERFFAARAADLRGQTVVVGPHAPPPRAGVRYEHLGDAARTSDLPADQFDCIVIAHALQRVWDLRGVLRDCHRALKPGGVLLVTVPGIRQLSRATGTPNGEYWRFTTRTVKQLFAEIFSAESVAVASQGNVMVSLALLHGLPAAALRPSELEYCDPLYQLVITARAVKAAPRA